ncbi:MAG: hypothetical protein L3J87_04240 [Thermoplasmata archaeon]|nr:hypothetical protein [Thermoplasmata archaeon]MCI4344815.1 hypothetical protein [Thermoplasmata archaeon]
MRTRERLAALFPWPFVGVAVLLLLLILVTPNLLSSGQPTAGSLSATAEFVVDRVPGSSLTHVYLYGLSTVRYQLLELHISDNVSWPPPAAVRAIHWTNSTNASHALVLAYATAANPVAFNVTALYVDSAGATVTYAGTFEIYYLPPTLYVNDLTAGRQGTTTETISSTSAPLNILLQAE